MFSSSVLCLLAIIVVIVILRTLIAKLTSTTYPTGNFLASGNGKGNSAIPLWWAGNIIAAVAGCAIAVFFALDLGGQVSKAQGALFVDQGKLHQANLMVSLLYGLAILCPIAGLVGGALYHRGIAGTHIEVDESGVAGQGVGKYFIWGDVRRFGFRLSYRQITNVDVAGTAIIVHASGTQYKCYVQNPAEIQRVIVEQQNKSVS